MKKTYARILSLAMLVIVVLTAFFFAARHAMIWERKEWLPEYERAVICLDFSMEHAETVSGTDLPWVDQLPSPSFGMVSEYIFTRLFTGHSFDLLFSDYRLIPGAYSESRLEVFCRNLCSPEHEFLAGIFRNKYGGEPPGSLSELSENFDDFVYALARVSDFTGFVGIGDDVGVLFQPNTAD